MKISNFTKHPIDIYFVKDKLHKFGFNIKQEILLLLNVTNKYGHHSLIHLLIADIHIK